MKTRITVENAITVRVVTDEGGTFTACLDSEGEYRGCGGTGYPGWLPDFISAYTKAVWDAAIFFKEKNAKGTDP